MPVGGDPWWVTPEERTKHDEQFVQLNPINGFITGEQAKGFFLQSQLPPIVLGQIWGLADMNADGKMDKNEFSIAMKLIQMKLKGFEVPTVLPPSLKMLPMSSVGGMVPMMGMQQQPPISTGFGAPGIPPGGIPPYMPPPSVSNVITMSTGFARSTSPVDVKTQRSASITSQESPTGSVSSQLQEWAVPHQAKLKYTQTFNGHDRARTGYLTGSQARNILVQTGLPQNILAQIWSLSDIDNDGKLTCEEFCVAMHLTESVRSGDKLPSVLPLELVPPSYRRGRSSSIQGGTSAMPGAIPSAIPGSAAGTMIAGGLADLFADKDEAEKQKMVLATFEDKRKENFEKGQAELEKRRQALVESQRREQEERERKDREEQERRERIRQEQERRRQMELEKQLAKQRELQQEQEEQKRKAMEQREAARREMERQRQLEWEKQRRQELMTQRQKEQEKVLQLKAQNKSLTIDLEQLNTKVKELNGKLSDTHNGVNNLKGDIDQMRKARDTKISEIEGLKNQLKGQKQRLFMLNQERNKFETQLKSNTASNPTAESFNIVMHSFNNKQITLNQLKEKLCHLENETSAKLQDIDNNNSQLKDLKEQLSDMLKESEKAFEIFNAKRQQVIDMRKQNGLTSPPTKNAEVNDNGWGDNAWNNSGADDWASQERKDSKGSVGATAWGTEETNAAWGSGEGQADDWANGEPQTEAGWGNDDAWPVETNVEVPASENAWTPTEAEKTSDEQAVTGKMIKFRALYAFEARNLDELSIEPGDIITIPEGLAHEPGWLGGELRGKTGWFPEAYVERMDSVDEAEVTPADNGETSPTSLTGLQETVHIVGTEMKMTLTGIQETPENISDNGSVTDISGQENQASAFIQVAKSTPLGNASPVPGQGTSVEGLQAQALFPWRAKKENHLTFNKGDIITVKEQQDMWWYGELDGKSGWFPKSYVKLIAGPRKEGFLPEDNGAMEDTITEPVGTPVTEYYEAMYGYQCNESGDLSFNPGDVIMVTKKDGDWWTGIIGDRVGVFPSNYVKKTDSQTPDEGLPPDAEVTAYEYQNEEYDEGTNTVTENVSQDVQDEQVEQVPTEEPPETGKQQQMKGGKKPEIAMVIAPYQATGQEQLSLQRGQLIQIRKKSPNGWWEGELQAKGKKRQIGWFPASYVKQLTSSARNTPEPGGDQVIAMYPYEAQNEDELTFQKGATITIISKDDGAWWKGELNGNVGLFPANYVQPIDGCQSQAVAQ